MLTDEHHGVVLRQTQGGNAAHSLPQVADRLAHHHPVVVLGQGFQGLVRSILDPEDPLAEAHGRKIENACDQLSMQPAHPLLPQRRNQPGIKLAGLRGAGQQMQGDAQRHDQVLLDVPRQALGLKLR
ncbi:hypothetical protein D3C76_1509330 [compost metagenome]